jgi:hypothetical protein
MGELDELLASFILAPGVAAEGTGCAVEKHCVEPLEGTVANSHDVKGISDFIQFPSLTHPSWIPMHTGLVHLDPSVMDVGARCG